MSCAQRERGSSDDPPGLEQENLARGMDQFFLWSPHARRKYHRRTNTPRTGGELGATLEKVSIELPDFRYRAVDASGVVENEVCPVFTAHLNGGLTPHPAEVLEYRWVSPSDLRTSLTATPWAFSPWLTLQAPLMGLYSNSTAEKG